MFNYLSDFSKIVVTGPQRSGTTICSTMIAKDLNYTLVDERQIFNFNEINQHEFKSKLLNALKQENIVIQAPSAASFCHELPQEIALIFMIRDVVDIEKSEKRIQWKGNVKELQLMDKIEGRSCVLKYENWGWQKKLIKNVFEVNYESLNNHFMWVDKKHRQNFEPKQIFIKKWL